MAVIARLAAALCARGLCALCALAALASPARAWHERDTRPTGYSAEALRGGEWRVYLTSLVEYGVIDGLEVGTVPGLFLLRTYNAQAKYTVWRDDRFAVAASAGFFTVDPHDVRPELPELRVWLVPVGVHGTWRSPGGDHGLHLALRYASLTTDGALTADEAFEATAIVDGSTLVLAPTYELRLGRTVALVFEAALSLFQAGRASGGGTYQSDDGRTTIEVFGDGAIETGAFAYGNLSASMFCSWEYFNFRFGIGYGHYDVPLLGVFLTEPSVFPELNVFWRF